MKVTLLDVKGAPNVSKDVAGGFGTRFKVGDSFRARLIERAKKGIRYPQLSLAYMAAVFKNGGHEVEYLENKVPTDADVVIMPSSIVDFRTEIKYADEIRKNTKAKVGFIRPFASLRPELYKGHCNFIIKGDPETVAVEISKGNFPQGLVDSKPIPDQDSIPFPNWDPFPVETYSYKPSLNKTPFLPVLTARGCVFSCGYCPYPVGWAWRKPRTPENVIEELKYLKEKYKIKAVMFRDPIFSRFKPRIQQLMDLMIKENLDLEWGCETRIADLDEELLDKMRQAGLRSVEVGVESFYEHIIKDENRIPVSIQTQEKIVKYCEKIGVKVSAFYVLGLLSDTKETIEGTINYAKHLNTFAAQFNIYTPYPGTPDFERAKSKLKTEDWEKFDAYSVVFNHDNLTEEDLLKYKEYALTSYYFRPRWMLRHAINRFT